MELLSRLEITLIANTRTRLANIEQFFALERPPSSEELQNFTVSHTSAVAFLQLLAEPDSGLSPVARAEMTTLLMQFNAVLKPAKIKSL